MATTFSWNIFGSAEYAFGSMFEMDAISSLKVVVFAVQFKLVETL